MADTTNKKKKSFGKRFAEGYKRARDERIEAEKPKKEKPKSEGKKSDKKGKDKKSTKTTGSAPVYQAWGR